jgi:hypothetical protein
MFREFEELTLDGHNYPTWALDVKIKLGLSRDTAYSFSPRGERSNISRYIQVPSTIYHSELTPPQLKVGICDGVGVS